MSANDDNALAATAGFTPGPWNTGEASWNEDGDVRYTLHGVKVAKVADCQLIAAAPDLLEALRDMVSDHADLSAATLDFARAAIAKAEGRA